MPEPISYRCGARIDSATNWAGQSACQSTVEAFEHPTHNAHRLGGSGNSSAPPPQPKIAAMVPAKAKEPQIHSSDLRETSVVDLDDWRNTSMAVARFLTTSTSESSAHHAPADIRKEVAAFCRMLADTIYPPTTDSSRYDHDRPRPVPSTRELTDAEEEMLCAIDKSYEIRDREAVWEFLRKFPFLLPVLADMPAAIASAYGGDTSLSVEVWPIMKRRGRDKKCCFPDPHISFATLSVLST